MITQRSKAITAIIPFAVSSYLAYKMGMGIVTGTISLQWIIIATIGLICVFSFSRYPEMALVSIFVLSQGGLASIIPAAAKFSFGPIKLTPLDILTITVIAMTAIRFWKKAIRGKKLLRDRGPFASLSIMMVCLGMFSALFSMSGFAFFPVGLVNAFGINRFFFYYILFFPALLILEERQTLDRFLKALVAVSIVFCLDTAFSQFSGISLLNPSVLILDGSVFVEHKAFYRVYSSFAMFQAIIFIFSVLWLLRESRNRTTIYFVSFLSFLAVVSNGGRALWLTTALSMGIALFLYSRRHKIFLRNGIRLLFFFVAVTSLGFAFSTDKFHGLFEVLGKRGASGVTDFVNVGGTFGVRLQRVQWDLIAERPIFGIGPWSPQAFVFDFGDWDNPYRTTGHMGYGDILLRHGALGLACFSLLWVGFIFRAFYIYRRTISPLYGLLVCVFIAANLVNFIGMLTLPAPLGESTTIAMVLMMAITEAIFRVERASRKEGKIKNLNTNSNIVRTVI